MMIISDKNHCFLSRNVSEKLVLIFVLLWFSVFADPINELIFFWISASVMKFLNNLSASVICIILDINTV